MLCFLPVLFLSVVSPVLAEITLQVEHNVGVNMPVRVKWKREPEDPSHFDLRFLVDGVDMGLAASVQAKEGSDSGMVRVKFPREGSFKLVAVDIVDGHTNTIGESQSVLVGSPHPPDPVSSRSTDTASLTPTPDGLSQPSPSSTTASELPKPPTSSKSSQSKTPAIVGGVIGGLVFLGLIISLIIFLKRRKADKAQHRLTFHRDLMVQHRPSPPVDIERRVSPSPTLPPLAFTQSDQMPYTATQDLPIPTDPVPTERQKQLSARAKQLDELIEEIRYRPGMARVRDQMRAQLEWLKIQQESPWALGETDVPPLHYELYMA